MIDIINTFPDYTPKYVRRADGKMEVQNWFRGVDLGHGGYVYSEPGCYENVALLDVASMHPTSAINLNYFGEYTSRYKDILDIRLAIKHRDFDFVKKIFDGKLAKYVEDPTKADQLAQALKICVNSTYGVSSASYQNAFTHPDNKNNIIALRGAIMIKMLQDAVVEKGFKVAHCKTDSIKIPNATPEIVQFAIDFGKKYGYSFELEAIYDRMCLVNQSVYIAKFATSEKCEKLHGFVPGKNKKKGGTWEPTGAQFAHPFVFKALFSKEQIEFWDYCETKEVQGKDAKIYLDLNEGLPEVSEYEIEFRERQKERDGKNTKKNRPYISLTDEELVRIIDSGHNYKFVGKVGSYIPVCDGIGGGYLVVFRKGKYDSVAGAKGYRWLESEFVKEANLEDQIDMRYYRKLVDDAITNISKYCDFEWFVSDDPLPQKSFQNHPLDPDDVPWLMPCQDSTKTVCEDCEDKNICQYYQAEKQAQEERATFLRR